MKGYAHSNKFAMFKKPKNVRVVGLCPENISLPKVENSKANQASEYRHCLHEKIPFEPVVGFKKACRNRAHDLFCNAVYRVINSIRITKRMRRIIQQANSNPSVVVEKSVHSSTSVPLLEIAMPAKKILTVNSEPIPKPSLPFVSRPAMLKLQKPEYHDYMCYKPLKTPSIRKIVHKEPIIRSSDISNVAENEYPKIEIGPICVNQSFPTLVRLI
jgi:hypothetical protein